MKIVEVIPALYDGGAERFLIDLSNELNQDKGIEIIILSLYGIHKEQYFTSDIDSSIKVVHLRKRKGLDIKLLIRVYKFLISEKPDIIHTHLKALENVILYKLIRNVLFTHTIHSDPYYECPNKFRRIIRRFLFRHNVVFPVTISPNASIAFKKLYKGVNFREIVNGRSKINTTSKLPEVKAFLEGLKTTEKTKVFITLARITKVKNQALLIQVFNKLVNEGEDLILLIIGSKRNRELAKKLEDNASNKIYFLGAKNNPIDYLNCADAFCLTSLYEGMPISLIEAFQASCIPICTPSGGIKDMITNGYNGFLAEKITPQAFENSVREFLGMPEKKALSIEMNCTKTFEEKYSIKVSARNYKKFFINKEK